MWWLTDQARLRSERDAIAGLDADWFQNPVWSADDQFRLTVSFEIAIGRGRHSLRLVYHNTFPASPPSIVPADGETRLSGHQYGAGGELCLEIRNDNWTPDVSGAMMIESAKRLLETEAPGEDGEAIRAPSAHDLPATISLRSTFTRLYVCPLARVILADDGIDGRQIEVGIDYHSGQALMAHVLSIGGEDKDEKLDLTPQALRKSCTLLEGFVFTVESPTATVEQAKSLGNLEDLLGDRLALKADDNWVVVLRGSDGGLRLFCHFANDSDLLRFNTVLAPFDGDRSGLPSEKFRELKVGVVGLGSLGSKIAVSLARSGVCKFVLVDGDILHTGNLERHDGDWRDVGRHKAEITAHRLRLIRRDMEISVWKSAIGAQVSSQEAANVSQALTSCDLIIDATANPDVFNHLADLSLRHNRSMIWGAVYAGGIGGEMARARVNKDPSPYDIRAAMNQYYATSDETPPISAGRGYDGSVGQDAIMQATDADISAFAAHISGFALDVLSDIEPSKYEAHAYLVGLRQGWLFSGAFDARPIEVDAPIRKTISVKVEAPVDADFFKSLFAGESDETSDTDGNS